jgi:hypothetical protein
MRRAALLLAAFALVGCKKKRSPMPYPYPPPTYTTTVSPPPPITPATTKPGPIGPPAPPAFPRADYFGVMQLAPPGNHAVGKTGFFRLGKVSVEGTTVHAFPCGYSKSSKVRFALQFDLALEPKLATMPTTDLHVSRCPRVHFSIEARTGDTYTGRVLAVLP